MTVRGAIYLGVGAMVGAGIFDLLGEVGAVAGSATFAAIVMLVAPPGGSIRSSQHLGRGSRGVTPLLRFRLAEVRAVLGSIGLAL
jgi:DMSO reductase anchor subunit